MSINLSPKHGVNPAIPICFFCQQPKNEVILAGHLPGDQEAPKRVVWDRHPCDTCKSFMDKGGVILISARAAVTEEDEKNPYRTGGWVVVSEDYIKRATTSPMREHLLKVRVGFVDDETWDLMGLPRGEIPPEAKKN